MKAHPIWATQKDAKGEPRNSKGGLAYGLDAPVILTGTPPLPGQKMLPPFDAVPVDAHDKRTAKLAQRVLL